MNETNYKISEFLIKYSYFDYYLLGSGQYNTAYSCLLMINKTF